MALKFIPRRFPNGLPLRSRVLLLAFGVDLSRKGSDLTFVMHSKENGVTKSVPHRTPPAIRRQREGCRLEFGMNYDKSSTQTSHEASNSLGSVVPYV